MDQKLSDFILFFEGAVDEALSLAKTGETVSSERDLAEEIFNALVTTDNSKITVFDLRAASNHFALKKAVGLPTKTLDDILSALAACLPSIVQSDGTHIPTNAKPEDQKNWVNAFLKPVADRKAWSKALAAGIRLAEQGRYPYSNARYLAVGDAARRIVDEGFDLAVRGCAIEFRPEEAKSIGIAISSEISAMGCLDFLGNLFSWLKQAFPYEFSQYLVGRRYAAGSGNRLPSIPIGYLYNLAVKSLPSPKVEASDLNRNWQRAISLARDFVACLNIEPYSNFTYTGTDAARLESSLRESARCDHCFSIRQWRLSFTPILLDRFFGKDFDGRLMARFGWDVNDVIAMCKSVECFATKDPNLVLQSALVTGGASKQKLTALLDHFSHEEQKINEEYFAPDDSLKADLLFKPIIRVGKQHVIIPAASVVGPAFYEAVIGAIREIAPSQTSKLQGDGTERVIEYLFRKADLPVLIRGKEYDLGSDGAGECDFVLGDEQTIIFVECKAKALTRGSMAGVQGDALLDFAAGMFAAQKQALRHERILRTAGIITFKDGSILEWKNQNIIKLSVTLLDHGALQDRMMLTHLDGALRGAAFSCAPEYSKRKQVAELNKDLEEFRNEVAKIEERAGDVQRVFHSSASLSVGQMEVLLTEGGGLEAFAKRISRPVTFGTFNTLLEYHYLKNQSLS